MLSCMHEIKIYKVRIGNNLLIYIWLTLSFINAYNVIVLLFLFNVVSPIFLCLKIAEYL